MSSLQRDQTNTRLEPDNGHTPALSIKVEEASNEEGDLAMGGTAMLQGAFLELNQPAIERQVPDVAVATVVGPTQDGAPQDQHAVPPTQTRHLKHFFSIEEAVEGERRRPVASADDDIQRVKSHEAQWVTKILTALHEQTRDRPMIDGVSVEDWKKKWKSFEKWLSGSLEDEEDVEVKAWMILRELFDLQERGVRLTKTTRFDASQVQTMKTSERLEQLIRYLSTCSCLASSVLKNEQVHEIVAHPAGVLATKAGYQSSNSIRQRRLTGEQRKTSIAAQGPEYDEKQQQQEQEGAMQADLRGRRPSAFKPDLLETTDRAQRAITLPPPQEFEACKNYLGRHSTSRQQLFPSTLLPNPHVVGNQTTAANPPDAGLQQPFRKSKFPSNPYVPGHQTGRTNFPPATEPRHPSTLHAMPPNPYVTGIQNVGTNPPAPGLQQLFTPSPFPPHPYAAGYPLYPQSNLPTYEPQKQHFQKRGSAVGRTGMGPVHGGGSSEDSDDEEVVVVKEEPDD